MRFSRDIHPAVRLILLAFAAAVLSIAQQASAVENPYYSIVPNTVFPSKNSLLPSGKTYVDSVPDTLDLATRAEWFLRGAIQSITPSLHDAPAGIVLRPETTLYDCSRGGESHSPCLFNSSPNWGKVMQGLTQAREMTGYDRNDTDHTLETQHRMMTNMLDWDVTLDLLNRGYPGIVYPQNAITPQTVAMQSLISEWRREPRPEIASAVQEFVRMHLNVRTSVTDSQGKRFNTVFYKEPNPSPETHVGYLGNYYTPFIHGKALRVMSEWYLETGDTNAFAMSNQLSDFVRNYENGQIWQNPNPARFTDSSGPGQFVGHIHSWLQVAMGLATHAEALRVTNPSSSLAQSELNMANNVYNFVKSRTRAGKIGNFGESGTTGDMALLGIKLSEQGVALYYDEVEAWTRNAMAETQIDAQAAQLIPNNIFSQYEHTNIGTKATGMFFADGTHVARIPFKSAGGTSDYAPNTFAGMYEVWNKTVEYKDNFAQINFALNKASKYLDVKSDLPYRGVIEAEMKSDIGPLNSIGVRVPGWADQQAVTVVERDPLGNERTLNANEWSWLSGQYAIINNIQPDTSYLVKFPIEVYTETIYEMRDANAIWYEGSYPSPSAGSPETIISYQGKFRGNTLVDISPRPTGGFPRYQRQHLAGLPPIDVSPPLVDLTRFVVGAGLPGDFNADGSVDAADYVVWREKLGTTFPLNSNADDTGASAGVVDVADYDLWRANFGRTSQNASATLTAIPEPYSAVHLLGTALAFAFRGRRNRAGYQWLQVSKSRFE
ncbi:MAG: hypothetical protein SGJ20_03560 [Planctomycetota bacterium]|nr:hypothetical protein [Planctomycetota bacterium]